MSSKKIKTKPSFLKTFTLKATTLTLKATSVFKIRKKSINLKKELAHQLRIVAVYEKLPNNYYKIKWQNKPNQNHDELEPRLKTKPNNIWGVQFIKAGDNKVLFKPASETYGFVPYSNLDEVIKNLLKEINVSTLKIIPFSNIHNEINFTIFCHKNKIKAEKYLSKLKKI